ncbi:MAG TPA: murein biosynthesis integral membrane protein MurJ [Euzebyales bacterium]|nr:murein biosynthesis integral membrane protein MurJ [Euzebyales bacterium]
MAVSTGSPPGEHLSAPERTGRAQRAVLIILLLTAAGRLLGFGRDLVLAALFGASAATDAFTVAWTVPETASPLLLEDALVYVLIPLFTLHLRNDGNLDEIVRRSLVTVVAALGAVSLAVALAAPWLVGALAPGLAEPGIAVDSVRLAALTVLAMGVAGYITSALRVHDVFAPTAAVYAAYNFGIIALTLLLAHRLGVRAAAVGLAVGSLLMVAVQLPSLLTRVRPRPLRWRIDGAFVRSLAPALPIVVFSLLRHGQVYVERFLGSFLEPGSISQLNYAQKIAQIPMALAASVAVVSFPALVRSAQQGATRQLRNALEHDLRLTLALTIPAAVYLVAVAPAVVGTLFERGAFTAADTRSTAALLQLYSPGLVGHALVNVALLPFFSLPQHHRTPLRAMVAGLTVTVVVAVALQGRYDARALALANACGIIVAGGLLLIDIHRRIAPLRWGRLATATARITALSVAAVAAGVAATAQLAGGSLVRLVASALVAAAAYLAAGWLVRAPELRELLTSALRRGDDG